MLTKEVKNQIAHQEKNLLNLEDTSDYDSNYSIDADSDIELWDYLNAPKPKEGDIVGKLLENLNTAH